MSECGAVQDAGWSGSPNCAFYAPLHFNSFLVKCIVSNCSLLKYIWSGDKVCTAAGGHTWHWLWLNTYQTRYSCWELMMIYIPQMTSVHNFHFSSVYKSMYAISSFIECIKGKTVVDMFYVYFTFPSFTLAWGCDPEHTMICQSHMWPSDPVPLQSADGCKHWHVTWSVSGWRLLASWRRESWFPHSTAEHSHWCADTGDQPWPATACTTQITLQPISYLRMKDSSHDFN